MAFQPPQPDSLFDAANAILGTGPQNNGGFAVDAVPSTSGLGTRQSRIKNERSAKSVRHLIHWLIPEQGIVSMYINPQNIRYNAKKLITKTLTKGGYLLQYWGEQLGELVISGTTGTSGIEGINVLEDIYRNEQLAFDPYALFQAAAFDQSINAGDVFGAKSALGAGANFLNSLLGSAQDASGITTRPAPTLASMAFTVECYHQGSVYRGFFDSFSVTESVDNLGLFNYDINFVTTQKRGFRGNFLSWHRSATSGASNSDPQFGAPHSFGALGFDNR